MRVAITGASGFVGRALAEALRARGDEPVAARRSGDATLRWSTTDGFTPPNALSGFDAVVHLAGENIASGRWTDARKARIKASRVEGTRRVVEATKAADPRPATLVSISAVGYYGTPGSAELDEDAPAGTDFLADVCAAWEAEAVEAEALGVRVARLRLGTVLGVGGGALGKMLPAFKLGVGGRLGDGDQYMSWVHLQDVVRAILHMLDDPDCSGPYNVTAPAPVPNRDFTKTLGKVLGRPTVLPVPKFALRAAFGEMADHILLQGQRVVPKRLRAAGFTFEHAELEAALTDALG